MQNDLLHLSYLKSNNIKYISTDINGHPFIIPHDPSNLDLYRKCLSDFYEFYTFISEIKSTTYKDLAEYYKLKYELKGLESLITEYNTLRNELDKEPKKEDVVYYNEEEERVLRESNEMVGNANASCMFVGPYNLAMFYRRMGSEKNFVRFMKEARKSAMMQENYNGIELCQEELRKYRKERNKRR